MNTVYDSKRAIPNKFLNEDGSYSTLQDLVGGAISGDLFIVVEELPETGEENKIYLVPKDGGGFYEYSYIDGEWNVLGDVDIDLSDYVTTETLANTVTTINSNIANTYNNSINYTNNAINEAIGDALIGNY